MILIGLVFLFSGCETKQQDEKAARETDEKSETVSESSALNDTLEAIWGYEFNEQTSEFEVKQLRTVDKDALSGETLEKIINKAWSKVQIKFIKTSNDTAYISIPDSKVLTQQMGSAGAESFMVSTTFTFTELKGINHLSFAFEEGDHAAPGVYNRKSWNR
ncbi:MAG: hypothetical protein CVV22_07725 [Ignavibacteriae bacterium HGW-Ignavibacteriae-1]|nr:MAG: hypothetical protein CVV22_07725 [Ignavibacteriae bacterium HGW-Ignavibacteriae-1]